MVEPVSSEKPAWAEVRDQAAHAVAGITLMYLIVLFPVLGIAVLVMLIALVRELTQHHWQGFGKLDMTFWGVGCGLFTVAYYTVGLPDLHVIWNALSALYENA